MSYKIKKLLLIADYGKNDLAFAEVKQRLYELAAEKQERLHIDTVSVDPFNTGQTAALVAQAAKDGKYDIIYHNTAPRKDASRARVDNDGEGLYFARYQSDAGQSVDIVGVNSGDHHSINTFALLDKHKLQSPKDDLAPGVYKTKSPTTGSQFRSRDVFPPFVLNTVAADQVLPERFYPPEPKNVDNAVSFLKKQAVELLQDAYATQLAQHGDSNTAYVTVIGTRRSAGAELSQTAALLPGAEVDALPLKQKKKPTQPDKHNASSTLDWIEASFLAAELALNSTAGKKRTIVAQPYSDTPLDTAPNLYVAKLDNGATIVTENLETLYFARDRIKDVSRYGQKDRAIALDKDGELQVTGKAEATVAHTQTALQEQPQLIIPKIRDALAAVKLPHAVTPVYSDGYGNIKLAVAHKDLLASLKVENRPGEKNVATVAINGIESDAIVAGGSFAVKDGELALSKGSSGWAAGPGDADKQFLAEVFLRGGNASRAFDRPRPGAQVHITHARTLTEEPGKVVKANAKLVEAHSIAIGG